MFNWYFQWPMQTSTRQSAELGVPHFSARCREVNLRKGVDWMRGLYLSRVDVGWRRLMSAALVTLLCVLAWREINTVLGRLLSSPSSSPSSSALVSTQKVLCVALLIRSTGAGGYMQASFTCPRSPRLGFSPT